jgi:hypothetical protein
VHCVASESGTSRFEKDFYFGFMRKHVTLRDGRSNRYLAGLYFFRWRVFFVFEMERREYKARTAKSSMLAAVDEAAAPPNTCCSCRCDRDVQLSAGCYWCQMQDHLDKCFALIGV